MKIVMLEPLGISEEKVKNIGNKLISLGHEFVFCGKKIETDEEKIALAKEADVLIIANSPLGANIINEAKNLKLISVAFTGVDHVDMAACRDRGIIVSNSQGYATDSTAELAVGLMLASLRNIVPYNEVTRNGGVLAGFKHNTLKGKTIGIVGTGAIGRRVGELVKAFGCNLIGYDIFESEEAKKLGIVYKKIEDVFAESDIVTLHAPLLESTKHIVNKEMLDKMKESAILINCARGPLVDSQALADAMNAEKIARAAIDVYEMEPPIPSDHPLLHAKNTIVTPHVAFYSEESLEARAVIVFDNVYSFLAGNPINVKN